MKKIYEQPSMEVMNLVAADGFAAEEEMPNGKSFPYNDGNLGWT